MRIFQNLNKFKKSIALIDKNNNKIRYDEIIMQSKIIKNKLKERVLVLIIAENAIGSILGYLYSIINDQVIILIDSKMNTIEIKKVIQSFKPALIICSNKKIAEIDKNKKFKEFIYISENFYFYKTRLKKYSLDNNLQLLLPTSGSLGSKKYVKLSKKNLFENTHSIIKYLKITENDKTITNMPYCYSYMLSIINTHLERGGTIVVSDMSIIQNDFWKNFKKLKLTSFNGVPYIFEILNKIGLKRMFSKNLRYITQAGGKLNEELMVKIAELSFKKKIKFFSMYGQTEASPRISYLNPKFSIKKKGSIGKPIPGTKMWIQDKDKVIKVPNTSGEIFFSGKNVMMGYAKNIFDLNKKPNSSKILNTGDTGYFDEDGFYYITGRSSRYAKIYGNRINLDEIESKMKLKNLQIACVGDLDCINIYYCNKKKLKNIKTELYKNLKQNLNALKFFYIKKIPRTSSKKINYSHLRKINDKL